MAFDSTRLIDQITLKGSLPEGRFEPQEILDIAYDALLSEIIPIVLDRKEEYYVKEKLHTIVAGKDSYEIPSRAIGGGLREVKLQLGFVLKHLERVDPKQIEKIETGTPRCFYLKGNDVVLFPTPSVSNDTLRLTYFFRPSKLVPSSEVGKITQIVGQTVSLSIPTGWTNTDLFDVVKGSAGYDTSGFDLVADTVDTTANTITFSSALPDSIAVGDYISLAGESCFPYLPQEGHIALIQCGVTSALESLGDPAAAISAQKADLQKNVLKSLLSVRVLGQPKKLGTRLL
jgi:hypothetical protein